MKRLFFGILVLALALWFHPFVSIALAIIFGFSLKQPYYEIIFLGVFLDTMYQSMITITPWLSLPLYTVLLFIAFALVTVIKKRMNIYA